MAVLPLELPIAIEAAALERFCEKWKIVRLEVFGSVLRDDFRPDSDIDFLATYAQDAHRSLFDLVDLRDELSLMLGRKVDIVSRVGIERSRNWIRQGDILRTAVPIYVAG